MIKKGLILIIFTSLLMLAGCCSLMGDDVCNSRPRPPRDCMAELKKAGVQFIRVGETVIIVIPSDNLFNPDSANFSDKGNQILDSLTCALRSYETATMKVAGYTDNCGSAVRNRALSERQAQNVVAYLSAQKLDCCMIRVGDLTTRKIDARIIYAVGYGQNYPVATNDTEAGRAKNRRIEIRFRHLLPPVY